MTNFIAVKLHYDYRQDLPGHLKYSRSPLPDEYMHYLSLYREKGIGGEGFHECMNFALQENGNALVYFPPGYVPAANKFNENFVVFSFTYQDDSVLPSRIIGVHANLKFVDLDGIERHDALALPEVTPLFYHAEAPSNMTTLLLPPVPYDPKAGVHLPELKRWGNGLRYLDPEHALRIIDDATSGAKQSLSTAHGSFRLALEQELDVLARIRRHYFPNKVHASPRKDALPSLAYTTIPDKELGLLGEELVFRKEVKKVEKLGQAASAVEWVSQAIPQAPYDIKTIRQDDKGLRDFYLEVKSSRVEGGGNVYISSGQIEFMENNPDSSAVALVTFDSSNKETSYRELPLEELRQEFSLVPIKYKLAKNE